MAANAAKIALVIAILAAAIMLLVYRDCRSSGYPLEYCVRAFGPLKQILERVN